MKLTEDLLKGQSKDPSPQNSTEIKKRFRILLREGVQVGFWNGHHLRIENIKLEETHMWASLICKKCGGILYIDADRKWHKDKIFGAAAMIRCKE
jgi:hypothetical protein